MNGEIILWLIVAALNLSHGIYNATDNSPILASFNFVGLGICVFNLLELWGIIV